MDAIDTLAAANKQLAQVLVHITKENEKLLSMVSQLTTDAAKAKPQKQGTPNSYCWTQGELSNNINLVNSLLSTYTPGCAYTFLKHNTALLDSTASLSLLHQDAPAVPATTQYPPKITIPNGQTITTTKTLCLKLTNLPQKATTAYCIPNIHNNLLAVSEL